MKNGIREVRDKEVTAATYINQGKSERQANSAQLKLQQRYDKGEISFEVYQSEWNKLDI